MSALQKIKTEHEKNMIHRQDAPPHIAPKHITQPHRLREILRIDTVRGNSGINRLRGYVSSAIEK
jgi:hypothetical protein